MASLMWLIPIALGLGLIWLFAFIWTVKSGQYEDPKGDAERIFLDDTDKPIVDPEDL